MADLPAETDTSARAAAQRKTVRDQALAAASDMMAYLIQAAKGEAPAKRERIDAAKTVLDRAGIVPPQRDSDAPAGGRGLTLEDLKAWRAELAAERAKRDSESKTIDGAAQHVDFLR